MRRLTAIVLVVTLIMAPVTSMITTAMGFSGEHVHYDHVWHTAAEWAQAKAAVHNAQHTHAAKHSHELTVVAHDTDTHHGDDHSGAPLKHSHADQVHAAPFVTVAAPQLLVPDLIPAVATPPASPPVQQHPYPPFRPPQSVLLI